MLQVTIKHWLSLCPSRTELNVTALLKLRIIFDTPFELGAMSTPRHVMASWF